MRECPEMKELDVNPLIQMKDGNLTAVDSVIKLEWSVCWKQRKRGSSNTRGRRCAPRWKSRWGSKWIPDLKRSCKCWWLVAMPADPSAAPRSARRRTCRAMEGRIEDFGGWIERLDRRFEWREADKSAGQRERDAYFEVWIWCTIYKGNEWSERKE